MTVAQKQAKNNPNRRATDTHQSSGKNPLAHVSDSRPEAIAQRELMDGFHNSPRMVAQRKQLEGYSQDNFAANDMAQPKQEIKPKPNKTGLPDNLKSGIEALSGFLMDNVKVHYNSSKPAQINALAYAQGTDIHIAPGQEEHLPHEAWHVVQQAQGRVVSTPQKMYEISINDDERLEQEANEMGKLAMNLKVMCDIKSLDIVHQFNDSPDILHRKKDLKSKGQEKQRFIEHELANVNGTKCLDFNHPIQMKRKARKKYRNQEKKEASDPSNRKRIHELQEQDLAENLRLIEERSEINAYKNLREKYQKVYNKGIVLRSTNGAEFLSNDIRVKLEKILEQIDRTDLMLVLADSESGHEDIKEWVDQKISILSKIEKWIDDRIKSLPKLIKAQEKFTTLEKDTDLLHKEITEKVNLKDRKKFLEGLEKINSKISFFVTILDNYRNQLIKIDDTMMSKDFSILLSYLDKSYDEYIKVYNESFESREYYKAAREKPQVPAGVPQKGDYVEIENKTDGNFTVNARVDWQAVYQSNSIGKKIAENKSLREEYEKALNKGYIPSKGSGESGVKKEPNLWIVKISVPDAKKSAITVDNTISLIAKTPDQGGDIGSLKLTFNEAARRH